MLAHATHVAPSLCFKGGVGVSGSESSRGEQRRRCVFVMGRAMWGANREEGAANKMRAWAWRVRAATGLAASDVGAAANTRLRLCEREAAVVLEAARVAAGRREVALVVSDGDRGGFFGERRAGDGDDQDRPHRAPKASQPFRPDDETLASRRAPNSRKRLVAFPTRGACKG